MKVGHRQAHHSKNPGFERDRGFCFSVYCPPLFHLYEIQGVSNNIHNEEGVDKLCTRDFCQLSPPPVCRRFQAPVFNGLKYMDNLQLSTKPLPLRKVFHSFKPSAHPLVSRLSCCCQWKICKRGSVLSIVVHRLGPKCGKLVFERLCAAWLLEAYSVERLQFV